MKFGVTSSIVFHAFAVGLGLVSLSSPKPLNVADVEALPVDIVPIESITKTVRGDKKADPAKKPAPKPTTRPETVDNAENIGDTNRDTKADAPKETKQPAVEKTEAPAEQPKPAELEKPTAVPTPELKPEPTPKTDIASLVEEAQDVEPEAPVEEVFEAPKTVTVPKPRPTRPKPETAATPDRKKDQKTAEKPKKQSDKKKDSDKIAALLNKEDPSAGGARRSTDKAALGTRKGNNATKLSQSEVDALRGQIQACWNVVGMAGLDDADKLRARVEFRLDRQGNIDGPPTVEASGGTSGTNRTFAGSAKRAVVGCAPYQLPADKFEDWADVVVNFSLKDML